jgi:hypothetical protein
VGRVSNRDEIHLVVGWPAEAPIKPQRMRLDEVILGGEAE